LKSLRAPRDSGARYGRPGVAILRTEQPYAAFVRLLELFPSRCARDGIQRALRFEERAHGRSLDRRLCGEGGDDVAIGADARIDAHVVIYPQVTIGDRFTAHAGAVVRERVTIGDDVKLQSGAVIGGEAFFRLSCRRERRHTGDPADGTVVRRGRRRDRCQHDHRSPAVGATRVPRGAKDRHLVQIGTAARSGESAASARRWVWRVATKIGPGAQLGGKSAPRDI